MRAPFGHVRGSRVHGARPRISYVGLLQHFYKLSTDDEDFTIQGREQRDVDALRQAAFPWEMDVLYELRAARG
jgi:hypothetical protein